MRPCRLFEAGTAIVFFGALAQYPDLQAAATQALTELSARGFTVPTEDDPVRVFPSLTQGEFSARHAGGWRPGVVYLRTDPVGLLPSKVFLRHELFHEATHRSCGGRLPNWAEEAGALAFSGELDQTVSRSELSSSEVDVLRSKLSLGTRMDGHDMELLRSLVVASGWPESPCGISAELAAKLESSNGKSGSTSHVLMSMASGRVFEAEGDLKGRFPPGSLLKIPYAAAVEGASPLDIAAELLVSDTEKLSNRWPTVELHRLAALLSPVYGGGGLEQPERSIDTRGIYLGERTAAGDYPIRANLIELGQILRASLWLQPQYFVMLRRNGISEGSTLSGQTKYMDPLLALDAMAKTGTVSDARGQPLVGHLMVAWPAHHPVYLAIFRQQGVTGASVIKQAVSHLRTWRDKYPARLAVVRVRLLALTSRESWRVEEDCPTLPGREKTISLCGRFRILSSAKGSKTERQISGVLHHVNEGVTILETDADSFARAVQRAEAPELKGSAQEAMQAVIYWNGIHGHHRHGDTTSLCDSSHCMVFQGDDGSDSGALGSQTNQKLVKLLDKLAQRAGLRWLLFASGGEEKWERSLSKTEWSTVFREATVLDIHRERHRDGSVHLRLIYPESEDLMTCEYFRNLFKLPSCPDELRLDPTNEVWHLRGIGAGHGIGLSVLRAGKLSDAGRTAEEILVDAYGDSIPSR